MTPRLLASFHHPLRPTHFSPLRAAGIRLAAVLGSCLLPWWGNAQQGAEDRSREAVKLDPIPQSFELWQDSQGFLWQLSRQGALGSAESSYFQAAMSLFVKGEAFVPVDGVRTDGGEATEEGAEVGLGQVMGPLKVMRDVWFDRGRAGVRLMDTFENTGPRRESVRVELKTAYQSPWQDLHGTEGRILGASADSGLGPRDFGVVVKFSAAEGRHDTLFVAASERDALRPTVSYSSNLRELTFSYDLDIEPGKKAVLVHWVVQRNLQSAAGAAEALRPFYQRRQLIYPRVPAALVASVRNFDSQSFPAPGASSSDLGALVSLNAILEPLGVARRSDDLLWITADNQLAGTVNPEATMTVSTVHGDRKASIKEIAAIQGGGGLGRTPRVFHRDGRVWAGPVTAENLSMKTAEGWEIEELRPEEITLLLCRVGPEDGRPPAGTGLFLALRSGDVLSIAEADAKNEPLNLLTPWGEQPSSLGEIRELFYASGPAAPRFRLVKEDGSLLTVFLGSGELKLQETGTPANTAAVAPVAISGAWKPGGTPGRAAADPADIWYDMADATTAMGGTVPEPAVLLAGNNLLSANIGMENLNLVSGAAVTPISPGEVIAIRRSIDSDSDTSPTFEVELGGGEILTGRLRESVLIFRSSDREWRVPVSHFIAYQKRNSSDA